MPLLAARVFVLLHVKDVSEQSKQAWLVCPSSKCLEFAAFPSSLSRLISPSETQSNPQTYKIRFAHFCIRSSRDLCDCVCMRTKETPNCHLTLCRCCCCCCCCCSAISNSPLAPLPFLLLRLLLLSVTLFVPVTHNDMSLCACYTPIYI